LVFFTRKSEEFEIESCTFNPNTKKCYPHDVNGKPLQNEEFTPGKASPETCQTECARRYTDPISNDRVCPSRFKIFVYEFRAFNYQ